MNSRWLAATGCLIGALALGVTACGGDDSSSSDSSSGSGGGKTLDVYSSLPLQGASRPQTTALVNGAKLALEQAGGKAGDFTVKYKSLDDSTAQAGSWTPEATQANARKVAQDDNAGVYLGEFNSGASAVSIPILNEAGVPQISPANTAVGLTSDEPGSNPGEPDKYYPAGTRTYARIVPKDTIQGAALATLMKQDGCTKIFMTNDKEVYGAGLAKNIELAAKPQGLNIIANEAIDKNAPNYRSLASKAKGAGRGLLRLLGHHREQRGPALQGLRGGAAGREALRAGRRRRVRLLRPEERRHPRRRRQKVKVTVATLVAGRVPAGGPGVLQAVHAEVRREEP